MIERTLILIKPDGVQRSLVGRIIQRFEDAPKNTILISRRDGGPRSFMPCRRP